MRILVGIALLFLNHFVLANEIEVSAKELIADEKRKITQLKGNVEVKRAKDNLKANEAFIYLWNLLHYISDTPNHYKL